MRPHKDLDFSSFKVPGPLPPAFVMELQAYFHNLPFGPESGKYALCFKAEIIYFKELSRAAFDFYTRIEEILEKPEPGRPEK